MHRGHFIRLVFILALVVSGGGCAGVYGTEQSAGTVSSDRKITLAVMPFHGVSEARGSGMIVSDVLANQLYALGKYAVVTPELVVSRLADRESDALSPGEAGALVGAPYLLTGRVTEYTYKAGVGETPVMGVTARLIEASSGAVLWSATRTGTGGGNWFQEDSLSRLTLAICKELADSLDVFMENFPWPARADSFAPNDSGTGRSVRPR